MLIYNATIINENQTYIGSVFVEDDKISRIERGIMSPEIVEMHSKTQRTINAEGLLLLPGAIDCHVHFREPGLTHKADISTESAAAIAGGITSYMDMPNTIPQTTTIEHLEAKYALAAQKSLANYSFYIGATNDNIEQLKQVDPHTVCGVKLFMGSSTGNMLVSENSTLERIFAEIPLLISAHCEDEATIQHNIAHYRAELGNEIPVSYHPLIRSTEACYKSTAQAVELAKKHGSRLHVAHISTASELDLFDNSQPLSEKRITAEACPHHLLFTDQDYATCGTRIKCNPAIKTTTDREALRKALNNNIIDLIATDHAPHTWSEKQGSCLKATSGLPFVEWSLLTMLEMSNQRIFTYEKIVEKMCHAPAELFHIQQRGFIRPSYFADLVLIDPSHTWQVSDENTRSKCAWSPISNSTLSHQVVLTMVNGHIAFEEGKINETPKGKRLKFNAF